MGRDIRGTSGNDVLNGTDNNIFGFGGDDDRLLGSYGNDRLGGALVNGSRWGASR